MEPKPAEVNIQKVSLLQIQPIAISQKLLKKSVLVHTSDPWDFSEGMISTVWGYEKISLKLGLDFMSDRHNLYFTDHLPLTLSTTWHTI